MERFYVILKKTIAILLIANVLGGIWYFSGKHIGADSVKNAVQKETGSAVEPTKETENTVRKETTISTETVEEKKEMVRFGPLNLDPVAGNVVQVSGNSEYIAVLRTDGTVATIGNAMMELNEVSDWTGIVQIVATNKGVAGLRVDGTVISTWLDTENWTNIESIYCNHAYGWTLGDYVIGKKYDGSVVISGTKNENLLTVNDWKNIQSIVIDGDEVCGLKTDGTVVSTYTHYDDHQCDHCQIENWTGIENVFFGEAGQVVFAVQKDGTALCSNDFMDVSHWRDLIHVESEYSMSVGITSDGGILIPWAQELWTEGNFFFRHYPDFQAEGLKKLDLSAFKNLVDVKVWSPGAYLFGLTEDGTLLQQPTDFSDLTAYHPYESPDLSKWKNIRKLYSFNAAVLAGIKKDGTAVCWYGWDKTPDLSDWKNVVEIYCLDVEGKYELIGMLEDGSFIGTGGLASWDLNQLVK